MGTTAARHALQVVENVQNVVAIEFLVASQALGFRAPLRPGRRVAEALAWITDPDRGDLAALEADTVMYPRIQRMRRVMRSEGFRALLLD